MALRDPERQALAARPTTNPAAYNTYLRARVCGERGLAEPDLRAAERLYQQAVALDTTFALAYAALARAHDVLCWFYYDRWRAEAEAYQRHPATARAYFDSTRAVLAAQATRQPEQPSYHALLRDLRRDGS